MNGIILAALVAVGVTAGIASAGIAALADGAAVLINPTAIQTHTSGVSSGLGNGAEGLWEPDLEQR
jgi:hypothetical protein